MCIISSLIFGGMEASNVYVVSMGTEKRRFCDLHVDCEPNASMSAVTETDSPPLAISFKNKRSVNGMLF